MRGGGLLSCSQVDKTEIRRRMTLQMQAETLGRADQKKKAERRKAKYRSQDLSGAEKQKSEGSPRSISRQAVILQTRRLLFKTGGRLYSPPNLILVGMHLATWFLEANPQ